MGEKTSVFVVAIVAFVALNGVSGSPPCRQYLVTCCCNKTGQGVPAPPVAVPYSFAPASAPRLEAPVDSNDLPEAVTDLLNQVQASEPSEGDAPRIARNTQQLGASPARCPFAGPCGQAPPPARSVSVGYPQPVGNSRAEGYTFYRGFGTYKVHNVGVAWYTALRVCASEGGTLAVAKSQAEADLLKTMFTTDEVPDAVNNQHLWVGLQERGTDGVFYSVFGDLLDRIGFQTWSTHAGGQPNDKGTADCVNLSVEGTYFDDDCETKYAFVCEKLF